MTRLGRVSMVFVLVAATCAGCEFANSEFPLVRPSEAKPAPKLYGSYRFVDEKDETALYVHLGPAGDKFPPGMLRSVVAGSMKKPKAELFASNYVGFVAPLGDGYIYHIPLTDDADVDRMFDWTKKWESDRVARSFHLFKLSPRPDGFELAGFDSEFLAAEIAAGRLEGEATRSKDKKTVRVRLTTPTKGLAEYFTERNIGKAFKPMGAKLVRLSDDVPAEKK